MSTEKLITITYCVAFLVSWVFLHMETRQTITHNRFRSIIYYALFALFLVIASALVFPSKAEAGEWKVDYVITSFHFVQVPEGVEEFNKDNDGIILEWHPKGSEFYAFGGAFKNSFYKTCEEQYSYLCDEISKTLGGGIKFLDEEEVRVAVEFGLADGYEILKFPKSGGETSFVGGVTIAREIIDNHAIKVLIGYPAVVIGYQYGFNE